ncbi:MAG: helix-hairpin-helix domain-containing protein [Dehalococcoidales bacterium]|nr:helix-hairpin-helix domain-containing protein [Dehalococcoidales bacterium]
MRNSPDGEDDIPVNTAWFFMKAVRYINGWIITVILLVIIIVVGVVIITQKAGLGQSLDITTTAERDVIGRIFIGGEVNNPGYYPIFPGDSIDDIIAAAGGLKEGAGLDSVELIICGENSQDIPQKIDINRAEAWLLQALPGVGEVKAQAIIEYRQQHGLFRDINEMKNVPGFGDISFENIKDFITVND